MIEKIILDYLTTTKLAPVFMEEPEKAPKRYIVVSKTGSGESDYISSATIVVRSYAESLYESAKLNESVKEYMGDAISLDEITNVKLNSDYPYNDSTKKKYRYQAVFDVTHY